VDRSERSGQDQAVVTTIAQRMDRSDLAENSVMVAAGGAHINVLEATDDFVVRRLAETCAHNCYALMMERKLESDGVPQNI